MDKRTAEMRAVPVEAAGPIEVRKSAGSGRLLTGHTAVFNSWTSIGGKFLERIAPGAFRGVLRDSKVDTAALFNHDSDNILGRRSAGTLRLHEDGQGLHYEVDLDTETELGRFVARKVERGELTGNSFAFAIAKNGQEWGEDDDGNVTRTITEVSALWDVGPVTFPAYSAAEITGLRTADEVLAEARSAGLVRSVTFGRDEQTKRLEQMARDLKLQLHGMQAHDPYRRTLEAHAAELARHRRRIA